MDDYWVVKKVGLKIERNVLKMAVMQVVELAEKQVEKKVKKKAGLWDGLKVEKRDDWMGKKRLNNRRQRGGNEGKSGNK